MKRMYGEFNMIPPTGGNSDDEDESQERGRGVKKKKKRSVTRRKKTSSAPPGVPDLHFDPGPNPQKATTGDGSSFFRYPRQSFRNNQSSSESGR